MTSQLRFSYEYFTDCDLFRVSMLPGAGFIVGIDSHRNERILVGDPKDSPAIIFSKLLTDGIYTGAERNNCIVNLAIPKTLYKEKKFLSEAISGLRDAMASSRTSAQPTTKTNVADLLIGL